MSWFPGIDLSGWGFPKSTYERTWYCWKCACSQYGKDAEPCWNCGGEVMKEKPAWWPNSTGIRFSPGEEGYDWHPGDERNVPSPSDVPNAREVHGYESSTEEVFRVRGEGNESEAPQGEAAA